MPMRNKKLIWQIYPAHLAIILLSVATVTWYGSEAIRAFHRHQIAANLEVRALLLKGPILDFMTSGDMTGLKKFCRQTGKLAATRITVTDVGGVVLGDSEKDPAKMENHANRPEIMAAITRRIEPTIRFSSTLKTTMMYVAIPLTIEENTLGTLRTAMEVAAINRTLEGIHSRIGITAFLAALLAALVSWGIARRISSPLEEMRFGAEKFAQGDLSRELAIKGSEETADLARALNHMARELDCRIRTIISQRNELEAVFSSMVEGVMVIDSNEHFLSINKAGARLINTDPKEIIGKNIIEVVRNRDLLEVVRRTLESPLPVEGEAVFQRPGGEFFFQINGVRLNDQSGKISGGIFVFNDVTRIRRLEQVRRDFVANVSHELRTPITSIKGFVETLLDGALHDPDHADRFLKIVSQKTDKLNNLVNDLLELSRIEQQSEDHKIPLKKESLCIPLNAAVQNCQKMALDKDITIDFFCPDDLRASINAPLLEQAVVNLVENAIKYSNKGSKVEVKADLKEDLVYIQINDNGSGISAAHLPRIFERFYRVDEARSSEKNGTGLGLAIVKHIAQAHGGDVKAQSTLGRGSIFLIRFPAG